MLPHRHDGIINSRRERGSKEQRATADGRVSVRTVGMEGTRRLVGRTITSGLDERNAILSFVGIFFDACAYEIF